MIKILPNPASFSFSIPLLVMLAHTTIGQPSNEFKTRWKFKTKGPIVSAPLYDGNNVFVGSYDSSFYSLDANTGKLNWQFKSAGQIGSTASMMNERIYFFSSDARLYCITTNGELVWSFKAFSGALPDRRYDWPDYFQSSPTIHNGEVFFGAGDGRIYAVNADTGKLKWHYQTGDVVHTKPAIDKNKLVVGSFDGHLYCLNTDNGELNWRFKTTGQRYFPRGEINGNPVIHKQKVFFGARDYNLYALDLEGGYCHWLKTFQNGWALPITPNDSVLYVGTSDDRLLMALDEQTGMVQWRSNLGFNIFGGMAVVNKTGYTGTLMGKLFAIDLSTGKVIRKFTTDGYEKHNRKYFQKDDNFFVENIGQLLPNGNAILKMYEELGAVFSQPVVAGNKIIFGANDGTIYCVE
jgi:outer membrane protein assembly factor BamB